MSRPATSPAKDQSENNHIMKAQKLPSYGLSLLTAGAAPIGVSVIGHAAETKKPNILILWGDDIGWWNVSAFTVKFEVMK
jgi:hypothetical protein